MGVLCLKNRGGAKGSISGGISGGEDLKKFWTTLFKLSQMLVNALPEKFLTFLDKSRGSFFRR